MKSRSAVEAREAEVLQHKRQLVSVIEANGQKIKDNRLALAKLSKELVEIENSQLEAVDLEPSRFDDLEQRANRSRSEKRARLALIQRAQEDLTAANQEVGKCDAELIECREIIDRFNHSVILKRCLVEVGQLGAKLAKDRQKFAKSVQSLGKAMHQSGLPDCSAILREEIFPDWQRNDADWIYSPADDFPIDATEWAPLPDWFVEDFEAQFVGGKTKDSENWIEDFFNQICLADAIDPEWTDAEHVEMPRSPVAISKLTEAASYIDYERALEEQQNAVVRSASQLIMSELLESLGVSSQCEDGSRISITLGNGERYDLPRIGRSNAPRRYDGASLPLLSLARVSLGSGVQIAGFERLAACHRYDLYKEALSRKDVLKHIKSVGNGHVLGVEFADGVLHVLMSDPKVYSVQRFSGLPGSVRDSIEARWPQLADLLATGWPDRPCERSYECLLAAGVTS